MAETHIPKSSPLRIDELDGLRGILASWVAFVHALAWCGLALEAFSVPLAAKRLAVDANQAAVDIFMILSGFVITHLLCSRPQSYRQFMIGRFFRIYPVYFVCLLFGWLMIGPLSHLLATMPWRNIDYFNWWIFPQSSAQSAHPTAHLLAHLTLLFGLIPEKVLPCTATTLLGPAWSITLEWQFYLLAPLLVRWVRSRAGLLALGVISAGGFIYLHFWTTSFLPVKLPLFLVGIGSYHLYLQASRWRLSPRLISFSLAVVLTAVFCASWCWMALTVWSLVLGGLFLHASGNEVSDRFGNALTGLRRLLLTPGLQWLGKISYPIYLVHWPVLICLLLGIVHFQPAISRGGALAIMLAAGFPAVFLVSWLLHKLVEKPLMNFGKRWMR